MGTAPPNDLRRAWRVNWLHCLYEFASPSLQRMSWIEGPSADWPDEQPWVSSFAECMCSYFDDLALDEGYQPRIDEGLVSKKEADALRRFHELADQYEPRRKSDKKILTDSRWSDVVIEAAKSWNRIKGILSDPGDITVIKQLEEKFGEIPNTQ